MGVTAKREALIKLGDLLASYPMLQSHYNSQVHIPDYRAFSDHWESSLYAPIRKEVCAAIVSQPNSGSQSLLYCAPGPQAPLLSNIQSGSPFERFSHITLADIDTEALMVAKDKLASAKVPSHIQIAELDFSGPFGQRLCEVYLSCLKGSESVDEVLVSLHLTHSLISSIFEDQGQVLISLNERLHGLKLGRGHELVFSEMVATFTAVAAWLSFRSALFRKFSCVNAHHSQLQECLSAATKLWQLYNQFFLAFHLDLLRTQTDVGGLIVVAFDTCKVYDDSQFSVLPTLPSGSQTQYLFSERNLEVCSSTRLSWRDHPDPFDVAIYGIAVDDFQSHTHEVELYVARKASQ